MLSQGQVRGAVTWLAIGLCLPGLLVSSARSADWPQWRGPNRENKSAETGLLQEWPKDGPPLAWKAEGLGEGVASVAVAGGRIFTLGYRDKKEFATALNEKDGKQLWTVAIGPAVPEASGMRWLSQRTPTVDGERAYFFTARGELVCLESATGKEFWRKDYVKDFGGKKGRFGYCDYPLVDGDKLICTPGGGSGVVALNKASGKVLWKATVPGDEEEAAYAVTVPAEINGVRQYVASLEKSVVGIGATDGKLLWKSERFYPAVNRGAPIIRDNFIFLAIGDSAGGGAFGLLKLNAEHGAIKFEKVWSAEKSPAAWLLSPVLIGDHVYFCLSTGALICIDLKTGKVAAEERLDLGARQCSLTWADGRLYLRTMTGKAALVEASPAGFQLRGAFDPPHPPAKEASGVFPVVAGGRLYLRDMDWLLCYDIKDPAARRRGPRPPFVPSPQDVVDKMLELADVKKSDLVVDLGCGDGRIVVTAAQKYGCKAIGYDLDKECVRRAEESVKKHGLEERVQIIREDIFNVDLSKVDVVTLYLWPTTNVKLLPQLEKMKPGSRIVSHAADIKGVVPDKVITVKSKEDEQERKLYLWTLPLKKEGTK
jgi:outer membrane protein assembly factor BamB/precorrin-6B methylase 2